MTDAPEPPQNPRRLRAMVRAIMENHFGKPPTRIAYKPSGLTNDVFLVQHPDGQFVVRISPDPSKLNTFIKEQWATLKAREAGVPTSEILEVGNEVVPQPYMIARKVSGREATNHPKRSQILRALGECGAMINSIRTRGFGSTFDWSHNKLSKNETLKDYLDGELKINDRLELLAKQKMLSKQSLAKLESIFRSARKSTARPSLNHGDLRLKNVIVDDEGEINALIDWEHCSSNLAPQWELSIALHDLSIDEKQQFLDGYGLASKKLSDCSALMKAFNIINYAPLIQRLVEEKNRQELEQYRLRLSGALDMYSL